jgi:hypothetical protein
LWFFGFKMVQLASTTPEKLWLDARQIIGQTEQRILPWGVSLFWQNGPGEVGLRSVFGYNSLESEAYQRFVDSVPDPRATTYDIWGAAYTVSPGSLDNFTAGERPLTLVDHTDSVWVYRRGRIMPIARLAYQAEVIADPAQAIDRIHAPDFDPLTTVILPQPPPCQVGPLPAAPGTAEIVAHASDSWLIHTSSDEPALLVLSETAYPGWRVMVDGRPAESLTAYTTIRAVCVPAGEHTVTWTFAPTIYQAGGVITLFSLALVAVAAVSVRRAPSSGTPANSLLGDSSIQPSQLRFPG